MTTEELIINLATKFCERFESWMITQEEAVKFGSDLEFGKEYEDLREQLENYWIAQRIREAQPGLEGAAGKVKAGA